MEKHRQKAGEISEPNGGKTEFPLAPAEAADLKPYARHTSIVWVFVCVRVFGGAGPSWRSAAQAAGSPGQTERRSDAGRMSARLPAGVGRSSSLKKRERRKRLVTHQALGPF